MTSNLHVPDIIDDAAEEELAEETPELTLREKLLLVELVIDSQRASAHPGRVGWRFRDP